MIFRAIPFSRDSYSYLFKVNNYSSFPPFKEKYLLIRNWYLLAQQKEAGKYDETYPN